MTTLPDHLYNLENSLAHGGMIRACGHLMRLRIEELVKTREGEVGVRRATHVAALAEVVYRSRQENFGTGLFRKELKDEVEHRLATAHLQSQEQHFRDITWWDTLDPVEARNELRSNLERLVADPPTMCLVIGIELQVLFDMMMRAKYEEKYETVITDEIIERSLALRACTQVFKILLAPTSVAA